MRTFMFNGNDKETMDELFDSLMEVFGECEECEDKDILIGHWTTDDGKVAFKYHVSLCIADTVQGMFGLNFINNGEEAAGARLVTVKTNAKELAIKIPNDVCYAITYEKDGPNVWKRTRELFMKGYPKAKIEKELKISLTDEQYKQGIEKAKEEHERRKK